LWSLYDGCVYGPYGAKEFEAHVAEDTSIGKSYNALFDLTTTHTMLRDKQFFDVDNLSIWQTRNLITMAGSNVFRF